MMTNLCSNIKDINSLDSQIDFLRAIYKLLMDNFNINNLDIHSFHISDVNEKLLLKIEDIFKDDKMDLLRNIIEAIEFNSDIEDYK